MGTLTYNYTCFAFKWLFSTNHKNIGTLYFIFKGIHDTFIIIRRLTSVSAALNMIKAHKNNL